MSAPTTIKVAMLAGFGLLLLGVFALVLIPRPVSIIAPLPKLKAIASSTPLLVVIGHSVQGRDIEAVSYGTGPNHLLFVGGIHGGYEWNAVVLAYRVMDYIQANPSVIPANLTVTIIPDVNPDAVFKAVGKEGSFTAADVPVEKNLSVERFNANGVDLNRNFDCKWQSKSMWQNKTVSAGTAPFSEPESVALRDFILQDNPIAVVFWHSQADGVYASQCASGILPGTMDLMNAYARVSGYSAIKVFDAYPTTGAADDWLASVGIPAVSVELSTHQSIDWDKNLAGVQALLHLYGTTTPVR